MTGSAPATLISALSGCCPRCGKGPLFAGYLRIAPRCSQCGFDYSMFDVGDGASVFVILIAGIIVVGAALAVESAWAPPYWVHAVLWLPAIAILTFGGLRLVKSTLMALQYKHQAREGRIAK
ncbi:MAG TPA: DUF983 domain-containing protein [Rhizomicrobium sp.]|jgi:uncharacterized protein (DUF983 family)|nr:DUF983 domain-containing protein [Rhizomicrobium sp.]